MIDTSTRHSAAPSINAKYAKLQSLLRECTSVCIGYSGGVDSVLLARVAVDTLGRERVLAVTGLSVAYPDVQRDAARACAARFDIPHIEIDTDELTDPNYAANPANRCYFCKAELWPKVREVARQRGFAAVLDGSNADDAHDYRPGFAAACENGVRSPLLEADFSKQDVRVLSRQLGLPTWDQPSAPCLSSRLPYGVAVTPARLHEVERAETALRSFGFVELRVRHHDDCARIELIPADIVRAWSVAERLDGALRDAGFRRVLLDVDGYRRGALNEALVQLQSTGTAPSPALPAHDVAGFHRDIAVVRDATPQVARVRAGALRAAGFRYVAVDLAAAALP